MAKVLDWDTVVSQFEIQSSYYVHFQMNTTWERYENPDPPSYRLNSITDVLLQGWLWHEITHEGWYAIKHKNQNIRIYSNEK